MNELDLFQKKDSDFGNQINGMPKTRIIKPPKCREIPPRMLKYKNAQKLANDITPEKGMRVFGVVDGSFIFMDFIEAWMVAHRITAKRMTISTLSFSQENIDSLRTLLEVGLVQKLDLIVSDYLYSHERHKDGLIPYAYNNLNIDDRFQLAAASTHCKIIQIETIGGSYITIHGSANLRSSSNLEQFMIEEDKALYDFNIGIQDAILKKYSTIKKSLRRKTLWTAITES